MSFRICVPPAVPAVALTSPALIRRRHIDMMRVCATSCRPGDPR
ncbi:hypothetical protein GA0070608_4889 [Micromonospora peucetia]|uniref:Uncharacterized protein n=1 Tax=Micromonospora peucetia TaxID=47871 RepID=A0A1C6W128_9ACTN|nr:hypothetical protein GA0070608_4889 [Micromonospora peucetia]